MLRNHIAEVRYNIQAVVDPKNCIPFDYKVANIKNSKVKVIGNILRRAK